MEREREKRGGVYIQLGQHFSINKMHINTSIEDDTCVIVNHNLKFNNLHIHVYILWYM